MNVLDETGRLLRELKKELDLRIDILKSGTIPGNKKPNAFFYRFETVSAIWMVAEFDIEDQGFPSGSKGYDGTTSRGGTIIRLPRELAELAFKKAREHEAENE